MKPCPKYMSWSRSHPRNTEENSAYSQNKIQKVNKLIWVSDGLSDSETFQKMNIEGRQSKKVLHGLVEYISNTDSHYDSN